MKQVRAGSPNLNRPLAVSIRKPENRSASALSSIENGAGEHAAEDAPESTLVLFPTVRGCFGSACVRGRHACPIGAGVVRIGADQRRMSSPCSSSGMVSSTPAWTKCRC